MKEDKIYDGDFSQIGENQIRLIFHDEFPSRNVLVSGFNLVNEYNPEIIQTPREDYVFIYRLYEDELNKIELCNDGVPWVQPIIPEPRIPTLDEIKEIKVSEMNNIQQLVIANGVTVKLTNGTEEHFTLTEKDQLSLFGLKDEVNDGEEILPWHVSDENMHCVYYSPDDMKLITKAAKRFVTYHVTYFRDLRIYIRSLQTKEEVEEITYGVSIPEKYQSQPLKDMLAALDL